MGSKRQKLPYDSLPKIPGLAQALFALGQQYNTPEERFWFALLERALCDAIAGPPNWKQDAINWFNSPSTSSPETFMEVCSKLNLEPSYVRRLLHQSGVRL